MGPSNKELQLLLQNRMVEELAAKQKDFELLTDLLEEVVFRCDENGVFKLLNTAWERKTGWPVNACVGSEFISHLDDDASITAVQQGLRGSDDIDCELTITSRFGDLRYFNLRAKKRDSDWYGSLYDITQQRQTMAALESSREQARKLSLVASRTDNLVIITDAQGRIEWVNQSFEKVTGYRLHEVRKQSPGSFLQGPDSQQETVEEMRRGLANGQGFNVEIINYNREGLPYWLAIDCTPVVNELGELVNFIAIEREISERKQNEQRLRDSERHYRSILNSVSEAIFYADEHLNLQYANPAWSGMTGHYFNANEQRNLLDFIHDDDVTLLHTTRDQAREIGNTTRQELRLRDYNGEWRRVELLLSRVNQEHDFTGALIDIDERWQATQAILRAKQEAEELSVARTRFVANMSHEIRTPLNAIIGMSSVLETTQLDDEQRLCLDTISNGGKALLSVINDVLDLARLDSQAIELENREFQLIDVCEEALDLVALKAAEKNVRLAASCANHLPYRLKGDSHKIRQLLINLLTNAVKFTTEGHVTLTLCWSGESSARGTLNITVTDSGIGIPPERLPTLFDAFTQADPSTTRRFGGSGLGLAICQQICAAMGGEISATSVVGKGSRFNCTLDLEVVEQQAPKSSAKLAVHGDDTLVQNTARWLADHYGLDLQILAPDHTDKTLVLANADGSSKVLTSGELPAVMSPLRLWRKLAPPQNHMAELSSPAAASQLSILIAEDTAPNQLVVAAMLKQLGYADYTIANNGEEALAAMAERHYDLVLLDIHMPVMDGLTAAKKIRENPNYRHTTIIAASADVTTDAREAADEVGFDSWLAKPFTRSSLEELLKHHQPTTGQAINRH